MSYKINLGDCLELMQDLPAHSIDMILCDLPYGTTKCKWDTVIPFAPMWEQYHRIIKPGGAIVLFGTEPFSSYLRLSNMPNYKYDWVWDKVSKQGFLNAKKRPLKQHENILVFATATPVYYPIMTERGKARNKTGYNHSSDGIYGSIKNKYAYNNTYYPATILTYSNAVNVGKVHPTQKPVPLLEYLIQTYTKPGDTVLDSCMGSGSTGVACINTGRRFIGYELKKEFFDIASKRLTNAGLDLWLGGQNES